MLPPSKDSLSHLRESLHGIVRTEVQPHSACLPGVAASGQTPGSVVSAAEPLVSLLASTATSLNRFAKELGFLFNAAVVLFLFGQNQSN